MLNDTSDFGALEEHMDEAELADACRLLGDPVRLRAVVALLDGERAAAAVDPDALSDLVRAGAACVEGDRVRLTPAAARRCAQLVEVALPRSAGRRS